VNNNDVGSNRTIVIYPSIDSIQEFKLLRNSYGPEYGQAMGAIVNITTRAALTAPWRCYYFGRNDALNATDFFNNQSGIKKTSCAATTLAMTSAADQEDKFFFFFSEEWEPRASWRCAYCQRANRSGKGWELFSIAYRGENAPTLPDSTLGWQYIENWPAASSAFSPIPILPIR